LKKSCGTAETRLCGLGRVGAQPWFIASDTFLAGTLRKIEGKWLFSDMFGGSSSPLSVDHYYFP
jgi:hypothetical protein